MTHQTESAAIPTLTEALMKIRAKAYGAGQSSQVISEIFHLADEAVNATPALPVPGAIKNSDQAHVMPPFAAPACQYPALVAALVTAEAALADIGDADREPGDDVVWCEARAAQALPKVREAIADAKMIEAAFPVPRMGGDTKPVSVNFAAPVVPVDRNAPKLSVWYGAMPESNGKSNFTAILHAGAIEEGITLDRSEYPDRVRYEADRARFLIGELAEEPFILDYDADKHSDYAAPEVSLALPAAQGEAVEYQFRTRADWLKGWTEWECCTKERYEGYIAAPMVNDWHYEVRALAVLATPVQQADTQSQQEKK